MRKWLWIVALICCVCGPALAGQGRLKPAPTQETKQRRFTVRVTPEMLRHSRLQDVLYFVDFVYGAAILVLVLATRISGRLREAASRAVRWPFVVAMLYFVLLSLVMTALDFPLSLYQGFIVPHQFDRVRARSADRRAGSAWNPSRAPLVDRSLARLDPLDHPRRGHHAADHRSAVQ